MPIPTINPKIWAFAPFPNIWSRDPRLDLATGFAHGQIGLLIAMGARMFQNVVQLGLKNKHSRREDRGAKGT